MTKAYNFIEILNTSQTLSGLDFGEKTIGIAISDINKIIATPIKTIKRKSIENDIKELKNIFEEYHVGGVVIGLPLSLDGNENNQTLKVRKFGEKLKNKVGLKVIFHDERYSSDVVFKELRKASISKNKIKKKIDMMAASYILQGFLDNLKNNYNT